MSETEKTKGDVVYRADAVKAICNAQCELDVPHYPKCDQVKWCDEVKALLALPSADRPKCYDSDMISRFDLDCLLTVAQDRDEITLDEYNKFSDLLSRVPSVPADGPMGEWKHKPSKSGEWIWWQCSECGAVIYSETELDRIIHHAYCGVCGARMTPYKGR